MAVYETRGQNSESTIAFKDFPTVTDQEIMQHVLDPEKALSSPIEREKAAYIIGTVKRALSFIHDIYPDLPTEFPYKTLMKVDPSLSRPNAYHAFLRGNHYLMLTSTTDYGSGFASEMVLGPFSDEREYPRSVIDLYGMLHEIGGHVSYEHFANSENIPKSRDYYSTLDSVVNEGFAVSAELLLTGVLTGSDKYLTATEREAMTALRRSRVESPDVNIDEGPNSYAEGYTLMQEIVKRGGMSALIEYISMIDPYATRGVSRHVPIYRDKLMKDPDGFLAQVRRLEN